MSGSCSGDLKMEKWSSKFPEILRFDVRDETNGTSDLS